MPNPLIGTGLHAIGGMSAASCYLPFKKTRGWHWTSFWLVQSFFAWIFMPLLLAILTVPDFFGVLSAAPSSALWKAFLLGAAYGFGGLSFGYATQKIGYSLTYTLSIGMSAILGTVIPLLIEGSLAEHFTKPGGMTILTGMVISLVGIVVCGWAGFKKEKELGAGKMNMKAGLTLTIIAGILSAIFAVSLNLGKPIADIAAQHGAGIFAGNANLIISTSGCFLVNIIWFSIDAIKNNHFKEMTNAKGLTLEAENKKSGTLTANYLWSALAGILWSLQFFFYGLGHENMGKFQYASWVLHMSMLIFFSYVVGMILKEWKVSKPVYRLLIVGLIILLGSFVIISYGTIQGEAVAAH